LDGREIYLHKNSVLNSTFEHLDIGDDVIFSEEAGDEGSQAVTQNVNSPHLKGFRSWISAGRANNSLT
jgi:hypothetical protein